jgi:ankyrin repeat protein
VAIHNQRVQAAAILINHMKDVDIKNNLGESPLHATCLLPAHSPFAQTMLQHMIAKHANVNSRNNSHASPVFSLCRQNNIKLANILYNAQADLSAINCLGRSLLHDAVQTSTTTTTTLEWILQQGVGINSVDNFGLTPFHLACLADNILAVQFFMRHDVNIHAVDRNKIKPLAFATKHTETFRAVVHEYKQQAHRQGIILVQCKEDMHTILRFAHYHHNLQEICSVLTEANIPLPCALNKFNFNHLPQDVPEQDLEHPDLLGWAKDHHSQYPNRNKFFRVLFIKHANNIVPKYIQTLMQQFIDRKSVV